MTSYRCLSRLMLQNWYMKDTYLPSGDLYIMGRCKKHAVPLQELFAISK